MRCVFLECSLYGVKVSVTYGRDIYTFKSYRETIEFLERVNRMFHVKHFPNIRKFHYKHYCLFDILFLAEKTDEKGLS